MAYLGYVAQKFSPSVNTAYLHLSAVAYHYRLQNRRNITDNVPVKMYLKGLKRQNLDNPVKQAKPMNPEVLSDMRKLLQDNSNLITWRTVWRAHIAFSLMLRWDDISRLTLKDVGPEVRNGKRIYRITLHGGKTVMSGNARKQDRIITGNENDPEACLVKLTDRYSALYNALSTGTQ